FVFRVSSSASPSLFPYTTLFRSRLTRGRHDLDGLLERLVSITAGETRPLEALGGGRRERRARLSPQQANEEVHRPAVRLAQGGEDRKSTRLNSSHVKISYAVFCL